jgi:hypothetical protein
MTPAQKLREALSGLPERKLKGVELLREFRSGGGGWFPADNAGNRDQIIQATVELIVYGQDCEKLLTRTRHLEPVPDDRPSLEYGL